MNPILVLASERSGTNMLRRILGAHSKVATPPPPHLLRHLGNHLPYYGPLEQDAIFDDLVDDAIRMTVAPHSHLKWPYDFKPGEVRATAKGRSLAGVVCALYELYAARAGAEFAVFKEVDLHGHVHAIRELHPSTRVVCLVRDGRDVCCSVLRVPSLDHHVYSIARTWKTEQENLLRIYQDLAPRKAAILVRYEDILEEPEGSVETLCRFIGLDFEAGMLEFFRDEESIAEAEKKPDYWRNLARPIMTRNKGKFLRLLSADDTLLFESVAGRILRHLGYQLTTAADLVLSEEEIRAFEGENSRRKLESQREALKEAGNRSRAEMLESLRTRRREGAVRPFFDRPAFEKTSEPEGGGRS